MNINQLARKTVKHLEPYQSARRLGSSGDIWLNANESPFSNTYTVNCGRLNRYSECQPPSIIQSYSRYSGVDSKQILTCRGADEGIDLLIRAFCEPGEDRILYCPPTYGMYKVSAGIAGVDTVTVPLTADWQLNLSALDNTMDGVKLVFVCSPNNPTGNLINRQDIKALLDKTYGRALVVIDEAYIDFCPEASVVDLLDQYPNLVILRTLSKAFALAGLRCGFVLAHPDVIQLLLKIIAPYPVPVPVEDIAVQALSPEGIQNTRGQIEQLNSNRGFLGSALSALVGVTVYESHGNYLLVKFPDAEHLFNALWDEGMTVRRAPVNHCLRISVGSRKECEQVAACIKNQLQ